MRPMSPVRSQPSKVIVAAVSAGRFRYPFITCGPRYQISPSAPTAPSWPDTGQAHAAVALNGSEEGWHLEAGKGHEGRAPLQRKKQDHRESVDVAEGQNRDRDITFAGPLN